jgi:hypothetical protein
MNQKQEERAALEAQRIAELKDIATGFYNSIKGMVGGNAHEALAVITMIHLLLWFNCGDRQNNTTEEMLQDYCQNFLENVRVNDEAAQTGGLQ